MLQKEQFKKLQKQLVIGFPIKLLIKSQCAPFTKWKNEINNTQVDDVHDIDVVMYDLIEYSNIYLKTSGSLWQCYRDDPTLDINTNINDGSKDVEITISLKYLSSIR